MVIPADFADIRRKHAQLRGSHMAFSALSQIPQTFAIALTLLLVTRNQLLITPALPKFTKSHQFHQ